MANIAKRLLAALSAMLMTSLPLVEGHGRLMEPPSRSSMWRFGFNTPINYDDNALNCGGMNTEWYVNQGKCGVCGDPWDQPQPRNNEAGGRYGKGIITRSYSPGQVIDVRVDITANHKGWFEFRLCEHNSPSTPITHECLDKHLLQLADGSGTQYSLDPNAHSVELKVKLPDGVTCSQCVLQWKWHGGNNFGSIQEEFYGCSDIAIGVSSATTTAPSTPQPTTQPPGHPTTTITTRPPTVRPTVPSATQTSPATGGCRAVDRFQGVPDIERYCREQCPLGNCPAYYCTCSSQPVSSTAVQTTAPPRVSTKPPTVSTSPPRVDTTTSPPRVTTIPVLPSTTVQSVVCRAVGVWQGVPQLDLYCNEQCPRGNCPVQCSCGPAQSTPNHPPSTPTTTTTSTTTLPTTTTPTPTSTQKTSTSSLPPPTTTTAKKTTETTTPGGLACVAIGSWQGDVSKDRWCNTNCPIGLCPSLQCRCGNEVTTPTTPTTTTTTTAPTTTTTSTPSVPAGTNPCRAVGPWAGDPMLDKWCKQTCSQFAGCDPQYCRCDLGPSTTSSPSLTSAATSVTSPASTPTTAATGAKLRCKGVNGWAGNPDLDRYCELQCNSGGPCPSEYCSCQSAATTTTTGSPTTTVTCYAINGWAGSPDLDHYCDVECRVGVCPAQYCACRPTTTSSSTTTTTTPPTTTSTPSTAPTTTTTTTPPSVGKKCWAVGTLQHVPEADNWCQTNCPMGTCPPVYCACQQS